MDDEATLHCPRCAAPLDVHCENNDACDWYRCTDLTCRSFGSFDRWCRHPDLTKPAQP